VGPRCRRGPRAGGRVERFLGLFYCRSLPPNASVLSGGVAKVRGASPPINAERGGGACEVRLGSLLLWQAAVCGGLRQKLLPALAEEKYR
jgi:hypothetical protein